MAAFRIPLDVTDEQLDAVLTALEGTLSGAVPFEGDLFRGPAFAAAALAAPPNEFSYEIANLVPVYLQMVKKWPDPSTPVAQIHVPSHQIYFGHEGVLPA